MHHTDYATCIWGPVRKALLAARVDIRLATPAVTIDRDTQWRISCSDGSVVSAPHCVLARCCRPVPLACSIAGRRCC